MRRSLVLLGCIAFVGSAARAQRAPARTYANPHDIDSPST
jgi:hypothetical protein